MIELLNIDCMKLMAEYPDKHFDLAIVDPPYQIERFSQNMESQGTLGKSIFMDKNKIQEWDKLPTVEYFKELMRVSKNQIIWGANHFWQTANLPNCTNFIFWDKKMPFENFSRGELAWTSFKGVAKCFEYNYYGNIEGNTQSNGRIHPTQKPKQLYNFILDNYAKEGDKILDTHLGSGSIAIACHYKGFDLVGCEIDTEYYNNALKRFKMETAQIKLL
jgi:site-specific DNA-methyltransferase (adenine-specific)